MNLKNLPPTFEFICSGSFDLLNFEIGIYLGFVLLGFEI